MGETLSVGSFYGAGTPRRFADALFTVVRHDRPRALPEHEHAVPHFCLLLDGSYIEHAGTVTIDHQPLTMVFRPAGLSHRDEVRAGGAQFFIIELGTSWRGAIDAFGTPVDHLFELRGGEPVWLALRLHREMQTAAPSKLDVDSLLFELCGHTVGMRQHDGREPQWLKSIVAVLDECFRQRLELSALASAAGVHPTHVARAFRRFRGRTVGDYVTGLRIQYACRQLLRGKEPVLDIALEAGFADQSHFTRVFRSLTGTTPGRYRSSGVTRRPGVDPIAPD